MSDRAYSRQWEWMKRRIAAGNCARCGEPRNVSRIYCDKHLIAHRKYQRNKNKSQRRYPLVPDESVPEKSREGVGD